MQIKFSKSFSKKARKFKILFAVVSLSLPLSACSSMSNRAAEQIGRDAFKIASSKLSKVPSSPTPSSDAVLNSVTNDQIKKSLLQLTNASSPGPNKNYYWEAGKAQDLQAAQKLSRGTVNFSADSLGRSSTAIAKLTRNMWLASKGSRQGTPLMPAGNAWPKHNPKLAISFSLTGRTYHGYMYNRSHSIADSLAGKDSYKSPANFTAGTRPQNVGADMNGGMRKPEETVENYWQSHSNPSTYVLYKVTPVYSGIERIPRGSIVDVKSSDKEINERFVIINSAEGYKINYSNGLVSKVSK